LVDVPESQGTPNSGIGSTSNQIGDEGDWMGVRPYRPGDSLRQVHWAQTAKRDQLVVFERQSRARQQVSIWLDTGAAISSKDTADDLVRILASISNHFVNHSWTVRVHLNNNWQVLQPGKFGKQVWMDQLAEWTPEKSLGQSNNSAVVLPTAQKGGVTIILTTHDRLESLRSSVHPSDSISWIELLTDKSDETDLTPSVLTNHNSVLQVASGKYLSEQLDAQWKKYSQGLGRSSHVVSQVT
jgi:hypothetical protein